jgi:hypothetical protein
VIRERPVIEVTSGQSVAGIARWSDTVGHNDRGVIELPVVIRETGKARFHVRERSGACILHSVSQTQSETCWISVSVDCLVP